MAEGVVRAERIVLALRRRPEPEVVIELGGARRRVGRRVRLGAARLPDVHAGDPPELPGPYDLDDAPVVRQVVVNMVAHLADALVSRRRVRHRAPFRDAVTQRLLDEDVLSRLERTDGGNRVPVVRRDDHDRVDLAVFEEAAEIAERLWFGAAGL